MAERSLRSTICTGKATLPLAFVVAAMIWALSARQFPQDWWTFLCLAGTTLFVRIIANNLVLIRERSWFLSSCFLVFSAILATQQTFHWELLSLPLLLLSQYLLLLNYQQEQPQGLAFYSVLLLMLAALLFPPLLLMLPIYWAVMLIHMQALTPHSLVASLLAVSLGALVLAGCCWLQPNASMALTRWIAPYMDIHPQAALQWSVPQWVHLGFLLFVWMVSLMHFHSSKWNDKIQTRMHFYAIITIGAAMLPLLALWPEQYPILIFFLSMQSAPLVAHFMVLGRGRGVDFAFGLLLVLAAAIVVFNLWTPLLNFS